MSETSDHDVELQAFPNRTVYVLALVFVATGLVNSTPLIPGWDELWRGVTGSENLKTRSLRPNGSTRLSFSS